MPTRLPSPMMQPCRIAMWPMVQSGPMVSGKPWSVWQTQLSCTFEPSPTTIGSLSPRSTALNQTEAPFASTIRPESRAPGRHPEVAVRRQLRRHAVERIEAHVSRSSNSAFSRRTRSMSSGRRSRRRRSAAMMARSSSSHCLRFSLTST